MSTKKINKRLFNENTYQNKRDLADKINVVVEVGSTEINAPPLTVCYENID